MPKKLTREEWICRAIAAHGNRYDYKDVIYKNKHTKVRIICPVHGAFEQLAGNHLQGKGCAKCAPNARLTTKSFIAHAREKHGDIYDYSQTVFTKNAEKVLIGCPYHGTFEQEANSHLQGSGCPICANDKRSDAIKNHPTRTNNIKRTVRERYGVDNVMHVDNIKRKMEQTLLSRYGVHNYRHAADYDEKYRQTMLDTYGVPHYSQTLDFLNKVRATSLEKYGAPNYAQSDAYIDQLPAIKVKSEQTQLKRYGATHYAKSEAFRQALPDYTLRGLATKRKNNTFATSSVEEDTYASLCEVFGEDDVVRQYTDTRYPYACDMYIKSRDLFIELNATWTHGNHWFGSDLVNDEELINLWKSKQSAYYNNAIETWTVRDIAKRKSAREHRLNYLVFWSPDLLDFYMWLDEGVPNGRDYDREYSWLPYRQLRPTHKTYTQSTPFTFMQTVKAYQHDVFYAEELSMWENPHLFYKGYPLQVYIYLNRYRYLKKIPSELTDKEILRGFAISGVYRGYSAFDAQLMQSLIGAYAPSHIFDPFAGWGERMLMSHHNDIIYTGIDINEDLKKGYACMIQDLNLEGVSFITGDATIEKAPETADMVITCPPYHDLEVYSDKGLENTSYADFLSSWKEVVTNSQHVPMFCFQINQTHKRDMMAVVIDCGFEYVTSFTYSHNKASHLQRKGGDNTKREYEEMLVFKKRG